MLPLSPADSISETRYTGGISEYLNCVPTDEQSMLQAYMNVDLERKLSREYLK